MIAKWQTNIDVGIEKMATWVLESPLKSLNFVCPEVWEPYMYGQRLKAFTHLFYLQFLCVPGIAHVKCNSNTSTCTVPYILSG